MHKPGHRDLTRHFKQNESARDIGLNYRGWLVDTSVNVRLCGEMNHSITTAHRCFHCSRVTNVAFHKFIIGMVCHRFKICEISRVRELVIVDDRKVLALLKGISDKVGANKSSAACD